MPTREGACRKWTNNNKAGRARGESQFTKNWSISIAIGPNIEVELFLVLIFELSIDFLEKLIRDSRKNF